MAEFGISRSARAVHVAGRDGHNVPAGGGRGHRALAEGVVPPGDDRAVASQGEIEVAGSGNRNHVCRQGVSRALVMVVLAPGGDRAVGPQRHAVCVARGYGVHRLGAQAGRHRALAVVILAPCYGVQAVQRLPEHRVVFQRRFCQCGIAHFEVDGPGAGPGQPEQRQRRVGAPRHARQVGRIGGLVLHGVSCAETAEQYRTIGGLRGPVVNRRRRH